MPEDRQTLTVAEAAALLGIGKNLAYIEFDYETGRARDAIRGLVDDAPDGLTLAELVESSGLARATLQLAIAHLERDGIVERVGRGVRNDPQRIRRPEAGLLSASPLGGLGWQKESVASEGAA